MKYNPYRFCSVLLPLCGVLWLTVGCDKKLPGVAQAGVKPPRKEDAAHKVPDTGSTLLLLGGALSGLMLFTVRGPARTSRAGDTK